MILKEFAGLIESHDAPVVLFEGKRNIPEIYIHKAELLTEMLAQKYPSIIFRSGNAEGSDSAFIEGIKKVDPSRIQIVAPYVGHRKKAMIASAQYLYPEDLSTFQEEKAIYQTIIATPKNESMIRNRNKNKTLAAKSKYLIRDTMKVLGTDKFNKPVAALFYVDPDEPESGGTGHTIRVCKNYGIPVIFQDSWESWL
ncbi:MAG: hypothetical protein PF637_12390 [Spirochaetes bacterium]|jgi:hypothetical protein|nr:hypothetical protein [Spirochaetota bacterium]